MSFSFGLGFGMASLSVQLPALMILSVFLYPFGQGVEGRIGQSVWRIGLTCCHHVLEAAVLTTPSTIFRPQIGFAGRADRGNPGWSRAPVLESCTPLKGHRTRSPQFEAPGYSR